MNLTDMCINRVLIVFYLISRVIAMFTDAKCGVLAEYRSLPLCSTKGPWEAKSSDIWTIAHGTSAKTISPGLRTIGQMIDIQKSNESYDHVRTLGRWNAAADHLGLLLDSVTLGLAHA